MGPNRNELLSSSPIQQIRSGHQNQLPRQVARKRTGQLQQRMPVAIENTAHIKKQVPVAKKRTCYLQQRSISVATGRTDQKKQRVPLDNNRTAKIKLRVPDQETLRTDRSSSSSESVQNVQESGSSPPLRQRLRRLKVQDKATRMDLQVAKRSQDTVISPIIFQGVVIDILKSMSSEKLSIKPKAIDLLKESCELFVTNMLADVALCSRHAGRATIKPQDIKLTFKLRKRPDQLLYFLNI